VACHGASELHSVYANFLVWVDEHAEFLFELQIHNPAGGIRLDRPQTIIRRRAKADAFLACEFAAGDQNRLSAEVRL